MPELSHEMQMEVLARLLKPRNPQEPTYFETLGRFIAIYAQVEAQIHTLARFFSKIDDERARLIFGGLRIGDSIDRLRGLMRIATRPPGYLSPPELTQQDADIVERCLVQFQLIAERRDKLVHRTISVEEAGFNVSNMNTAKSLLNAEWNLIITLKDLDAMKMDLMVTYLQLGGIMRRDPDDPFGPSDYGPWRYIPPQPNPQKPEHPLGRRARKRQRRASQKKS